MEVRTVELTGQAFLPEQVPPPRGSEVVFAGRSNVGKSSLINRLLGKRNIARVSSTPGKTRGAFFYGINDSRLTLVDLPGFGFAKGARTQRADWEALTAGILSRPGDRLLVQLVDMRLPTQEIDRLAADWFDSLGPERIVVGTKADKLSKNKLLAQVRELAKAFGAPVVPTSAETGDGLRELWKEIDTRLGGRPRTKEPEIRHGR